MYFGGASRCRLFGMTSSPDEQFACCTLRAVGLTLELAQPCNRSFRTLLPQGTRLRKQPFFWSSCVFSEGEWQRAVSVDVPGTAKLYFQRSADFVFISVQYTSRPSGIVDLHVSPREGEVFDLHASAKLGERQLRDNTFPEWNWWNNRDWTANTSRVDSFEKRTFLPAPIREYQIRYSRFSSSTWRVRFELTAMGTNNETLEHTIFPQGTSDNSTAGWLQLRLE